VDRIAFYDINPGASIVTAGDIDTFNVFNNINLTDNATINVGRDLNLLTVGGSVTIDGNSRFVVGRDLGLVTKPAKGSDPGGRGGTIEGNLAVGPTGEFRIVRSLGSTLFVFGQVTGGSRIFIASGASNLVALGGITP
jgi:hypothetical protein